MFLNPGVLELSTFHARAATRNYRFLVLSSKKKKKKLEHHVDDGGGGEPPLSIISRGVILEIFELQAQTEDAKDRQDTRVLSGHAVSRSDTRSAGSEAHTCCADLEI